jgi:hypothetical protein
MNSLLSIAVLLTIMPALGAGYQFPSAASSKSPDGKWELTCRSSVDGQPDAEPLLMLKKVGGASFELRRVGRGCDTLWSPDSSNIAVTDWWASDRSDVFIYHLAHGAPSWPVRKLLPKGDIPERELGGHRYFEAIKWLDGQRIQVKVSGHTDEAPVYLFEHKYIFDVGSGRLERIGKKPNQPVQRTGASPLPQETNPTSGAAGSRR